MRKPQQIGREPGDGGDDQRVAQQLAHEAALAVPRHGPDGRDVEDRHAHADQHGNQQHPLRPGQALGQGQPDEGVEAKRHLRTRRMVARGDMAPQPGPVRQAVGQRDAREPRKHARREQIRGGVQVDRAFEDGVKQQHRKEQVIHQALHGLPDGAVERREAAQQVAKQNKRKIGEKQLRIVHGLRIARPAIGTQREPLGQGKVMAPLAATHLECCFLCCFPSA
jgi:hypothetical protein